MSCRVHSFLIMVVFLLLTKCISDKVGLLIIFNKDADLPVYVGGVGEDGQGGRDVDGDDDPGSGQDVLAVGGGGGQSGYGH